MPLRLQQVRPRKAQSLGAALGEGRSRDVAGVPVFETPPLMVEGTLPQPMQPPPNPPMPMPTPPPISTPPVPPPAPMPEPTPVAPMAPPPAAPAPPAPMINIPPIQMPERQEIKPPKDPIDRLGLLQLAKVGKTSSALNALNLNALARIVDQERAVSGRLSDWAKIDREAEAPSVTNQSNKLLSAALSGGPEAKFAMAQLDHINDLEKIRLKQGGALQRDVLGSQLRIGEGQALGKGLDADLIRITAKGEQRARIQTARDANAAKRQSMKDGEAFRRAALAAQTRGDIAGANNYTRLARDERNNAAKMERLEKDLTSKEQRDKLKESGKEYRQTRDIGFKEKKLEKTEFGKGARLDKTLTSREKISADKLAQKESQYSRGLISKKELQDDQLRHQSVMTGLNIGDRQKRAADALEQKERQFDRGLISKKELQDARLEYDAAKQEKQQEFGFEKQDRKFKQDRIKQDADLEFRGRMQDQQIASREGMHDRGILSREGLQKRKLEFTQEENRRKHQEDLELQKLRNLGKVKAQKAGGKLPKYVENALKTVEGEIKENEGTYNSIQFRNQVNQDLQRYRQSNDALLTMSRTAREALLDETVKAVQAQGDAPGTFSQAIDAIIARVKRGVIKNVVPGTADSKDAIATLEAMKGYTASAVADLSKLGAKGRTAYPDEQRIARSLLGLVDPPDKVYAQRLSDVKSLARNVKKRFGTIGKFPALLDDAESMEGTKFARKRVQNVIGRVDELAGYADTLHSNFLREKEMVSGRGKEFRINKETIKGIAVLKGFSQRWGEVDKKNPAAVIQFIKTLKEEDIKRGQG